MAAGFGRIARTAMLYPGSSTSAPLTASSNEGLHLLRPQERSFSTGQPVLTSAPLLSPFSSSFSSSFPSPSTLPLSSSSSLLRVPTSSSSPSFPLLPTRTFFTCHRSLLQTPSRCSTWLETGFRSPQFGARLMASKNTDYYQILGVNKKASQDEIKKAYRAKARELHPDVNKGPEASKQFAEVSAAYDVLGDPEKRSQYDQFGPEAFDGSGGAPNWGAAEEMFRQWAGKGGFGGFADFFEHASGGGGSSEPQAVQGDHIHLSLNLSFEEAVRGAEKEVAYFARVQCEACNGDGLAKGASRKTCKPCKGSGRSFRNAGFIQMVETCRKCGGVGTVIEDPCRKCDGEGSVKQKVQLRVTIPEGADDGLNLRFAHKGHAGTNNGPSGHLFIVLHTASDDLFERKGADIHLNVPITVSQAILGAKIKVPTLHGEVEVVVPPGSQSGETRVLRGKGIKKINTDQYGSQHLHFQVVIPKTITPSQREHLERFAQEEKIEPTPSWLSKLKKWAAKII